MLVQAGARTLACHGVDRALLGAGIHAEGELSGPGIVPDDHAAAAGRSRSRPILCSCSFPGSTRQRGLPARKLRIVAGAGRCSTSTPADVTLQVIEQILVSSVKTKPFTLDEIRSKQASSSTAIRISASSSRWARARSSTPVTSTSLSVFDQKAWRVPPAPTPAPDSPGASRPAPCSRPCPPSCPCSSAPATRPRTPRGTDPADVQQRPADTDTEPARHSRERRLLEAVLLGEAFRRERRARWLGPQCPRRQRDHQPAPVAGLGRAQRMPALAARYRGRPAAAQAGGAGRGPRRRAETADDTTRSRRGNRARRSSSSAGDAEGFHPISFDVGAVLDGLPAGPVNITGKASGGVLVQQPVLRHDLHGSVCGAGAGSPSSSSSTITNIGQGAANDLHVGFDDNALSHVTLLGDQEQIVDTLGPGRREDPRLRLRERPSPARSWRATCASTRRPAVTGQIHFTLGVGERGVPLSPDTLVLPNAVDQIPPGVVSAAMRVLGQAWSIANAPAGTLPATVIRTSKTVVTQKALALAEAGLRVQLGEPLDDALRDLALRTSTVAARSTRASTSSFARRKRATPSPRRWAPRSRTPSPRREAPSSTSAGWPRSPLLAPISSRSRPRARPAT